MTQVNKFANHTFVALAIGLLVAAGPDRELFAQDGSATAVQPSKPKYTAAQLNKVQTLQLVASSSNARTNRLTVSIRSVLSLEQQRQCRQIVAGYGKDFDRLRDQRNQIMANATDENGTSEKLLLWRTRTFELAKKIRQDLRANVLTGQQRKDVHREFLRQNELKAAKAKAVSDAKLATGKVSGLPVEKKVGQP